MSDGSVNYQAQLQQAIDAAKGTIVFPPIQYKIDENIRIDSDE